VKELDSFPFGRSAECGLFAPLSKTVLRHGGHLSWRISSAAVENY